MPDAGVVAAIESGPDATTANRRDFLKWSSLVLGSLALAACDDELVAAPPVERKPGIPVVPTDDMQPQALADGPFTVRSGTGEWLTYFGQDALYFWPAGGARRGPRFIMSTSRTGLSGGYGLQLDRPYGDRAPLEIIYSVDGIRTWEIGLDFQEDASGQGRGPDYVLAYDNSDPPGDRFRMAPGGYTLHSPRAGSPYTSHRFHIVGGNSSIDRAADVLYVQSGSRGNPGVANWLIRGQGRDPDTGAWGREIFGVGVDGRMVGKGLTLSVADGERDLVSLEAADDTGQAWLAFVQADAEWRIGVVDSRRALAVRFGEDGRFLFSPDGRAYADQGFLTFAPVPPRAAAAMAPRDWCDWAFQDAAKPLKPYPGVPTDDHPEIVRKAEETGRTPSDIVDEEHRRYARDVSRIAVGTSRWAHEVQDALEEAHSFEEFRARLTRRTIG